MFQRHYFIRLPNEVVERCLARTTNYFEHVLYHAFMRATISHMTNELPHPMVEDFLDNFENDVMEYLRIHYPHLTEEQIIATMNSYYNAMNELAGVFKQVIFKSSINLHAIDISLDKYIKECRSVVITVTEPF